MKVGMSMSEKNIVSGQLQWERRLAAGHRFVCMCHDEMDQSYRHCGCRHCRQRRYNERYDMKK